MSEHELHAALVEAKRDGADAAILHPSALADLALLRSGRHVCTRLCEPVLNVAYERNYPPLVPIVIEVN